VRDDDGEVVEELDVDIRCRAGDEAEKGRGADERWEEGEEEVIAKLRGPGKEVVFSKGVQGAFGDDEGMSALEVPERTDGVHGDVVPDALALGVNLVKGVVFGVLARFRRRGGGAGVVCGPRGGVWCGGRLGGDAVRHAASIRVF